MIGATITLADFGLDPAGRMARMRRIGDVLLSEWKAEARKVLRGTLTTYLNALDVRDVSENSVTVCLPGEGVDERVAQLARIVEFGMGPGGIGTEGPYDVRTFLLSGRGRRMRWGENGPYVNVPFGFRQMDIGLAASGVGSHAAVKAASALAPTTSDGHRTIWGGRLPAGMANKMRSHHVSDPLQGLVRKAAAFSSKDGKPVVQTTGFQTWRTASWSNTDPRAWRSSGVAARRVGDVVAARLNEILRDAL